MKSFIISILILIAIITSAFISMHKLEHTSETMLHKTNEITQSIQNNDFTSALALTKELSAYVEDNTLLFSTMMDHNSITSIEVYISELERYISENVKYDALAKSAVLERLIKNLPRNYEVRLENIL